MSVKIIKCVCEHEQQDRMYGKGRRVGNETRGTSDTKKYRCTVCERVI